MKISLLWLREFVELSESTEELRAVLDDLGLVVEGIEHVGEGLGDVIVARIDEIRAIEGADRVRLVVVDAGDGPLEIVCGATNFAVGNHVPLAPVGAILPGGFVIAERKMRGVTSNGMLCSSRELGLSDDHEGLMILDDLISPKVGEGLLEALSLTPDVVFDISVEGNRPDAWSVAGVARDPVGTSPEVTGVRGTERAREQRDVRLGRNRCTGSLRAPHGVGTARREGRAVTGVDCPTAPDSWHAANFERG